MKRPTPEQLYSAIDLFVLVSVMGLATWFAFLR
jgi:hypothetical protein